MGEGAGEAGRSVKSCSGKRNHVCKGLDQYIALRDFFFISILPPCIYRFTDGYKYIEKYLSSFPWGSQVPSKWAYVARNSWGKQCHLTSHASVLEFLL